MQTVLSSYETKKVSKQDTKSNWMIFMFVSKKRKNVFRKRSTINACESGFRELEKLGFEFGAFGFGGTHVHLAVNVPEKYSVLDTKIMLKSNSSKKIFLEKPNFRKLYPKGEFWSRYEHHHGFGVDQVKALKYVESQPQHHNISIIEDV